MRTLVRLFFVLVLLVVVGGGGYDMGYRAGAAREPSMLPGVLGGETGTSGSGAAAEVREGAREIGDTLASAGSQASAFLSDAALTTKIKSKMGLDDMVPASKIGVSTSHGVVTLTGAVSSAQERDRAVRLARETKGVTQVVDRMTVGR